MQENYPTVGAAPMQTPQAKPYQNPDFAEQTVTPKTPAPALPITPQLIGASIASLLLALLWFSIFSVEALESSGFYFEQSTYLEESMYLVLMLPGLGVPLFTIAFFGTMAAVLGKRMRYKPSIILYLIAVIATSFIPAVFSNQTLSFLTIALLPPLCLFGYFLLAGYEETPWCKLSAFAKSLWFSLTAAFRHWIVPFKALVGLDKKGRLGIAAFALGVTLALVLLGVLLPLLISADSVFGSFFTDMAKWFRDFDVFRETWKGVRILLVAPLIFSLLYAAYNREAGLPSAKTNVSPIYATPIDEDKKQQGVFFKSLVSISFFSVLNILFMSFAVVQVIYLFGGTESVQMSGGYAEYARSGFFQLVAVASINLAAILSVVTAIKAEGKLRIVLVVMELILVACTFIVLLSAGLRMSYYISEYGLTLLRVLTLFGMTFIALCLIAVAIKAINQQFNFFRVCFTGFIALWLVFNFANIDARIADHNVNGYLEGSIKQIDVSYLGELSPEVLPALERLGTEKPDYRKTVDNWKDVHTKRAQTLDWTRWNLSYALLMDLNPQPTTEQHKSV